MILCTTQNLPKGKIYIFPFHMYLELDSSYLRSAHMAGHKRIFTTASYVRIEANVHQDAICRNWRSNIFIEIYKN